MGSGLSIEIILLILCLNGQWMDIALKCNIKNKIIVYLIADIIVTRPVIVSALSIIHDFIKTTFILGTGINALRNSNMARYMVVQHEI